MKRNLAPAGYLILQESEQARLKNEYRRAFGPYFGVDRLPPFLPPPRDILGEPTVQEERLYAALDEWCEVQLEKTAFIPNRCQALRLLKSFQAFVFSI